MPPQGLLEHGVQVGQPWQVFLGDRLVATDLSDFLVEAILMLCKLKEMGVTQSSVNKGGVSGQYLVFFLWKLKIY